MQGRAEEKVPVMLQRLLVSGSSRSRAASWGGQAVRWWWPQHRQCPHQPGYSPAASELDRQRWVWVTRSHWLLQPKWGDESGPESIQGVQSRATEGAVEHPGEPMSEPGQQGTGRGQGMPTPQLRQDVGVWAWTEMVPLDLCVEWGFSARREKRTCALVQWKEGTTTTRVHLI